MTGFGTSLSVRHERQRLLPGCRVDGTADRGVGRGHRSGASRRSWPRGSPPGAAGPWRARARPGSPRRRRRGVVGDLVHRLERRPDEARDRARASDADRRRPDDDPGTRQRRDVVDAEDVDGLAGPLELDGLVVGEARSPRRRRPGATAAPCPKSGYSTIVRSATVCSFDASSAWSMIQDEPYLPGIPSFLPTSPSASVDPAARLGEHDRRELAVDRRDVLDRNALADGRDHARAVRQAEIDRALRRPSATRSASISFWNVTSGPPRRSSRPGRPGRSWANWTLGM